MYTPIYVHLYMYVRTYVSVFLSLCAHVLRWSVFVYLYIYIFICTLYKYVPILMAARLPGLRVRILLGAWISVFVSVVCFRGLCDRPITRPEVSYQMWCV